MTPRLSNLARTGPGDLLAAAVLALLFALATALLIARLEAPPLTVQLDQGHPAVRFAGFHGPERNEQGVFRWTAPSATIAAETAAFSGYRFTFALRDAPDAPGRRVTVLADGEPIATVPLDARPRRYSFVPPRPLASASGARTTWEIGLQTTPYTPSGDRRELGVLVTAVEATPVGSARPALPPLLVPLLVLLAVYGVLRVMRLRPLPALAIVLIPVGLYAVLAWRSPRDGLDLAYLPLAHPWRALGAVALVAAAGVPAAVPPRQLVRGLPLLVLLVPLAQTAVLVWAIWSLSLDVPFWDEWESVDLVRHAEQGTLGWSHFWAFHNEHRIVVPRIINLLLIELTRWSRPWEMTFNLGLALAQGGVLLWCVRHTFGSRRAMLALSVPLSLLCLSWSQYENWLSPFTINLILTIVGAVGCTWALMREPVGNGGFGLALLSALVSSLSSSAGLMLWPAFLPQVLLRLGYHRALVWVAAAVLIGIPYFAGFPARASTSTPPLDVVRYALAFVGAPLGYPNVARAQQFGSGLLLLAALNLLAARRYRVDLRPLIPWSGLGLFALASTAIISLGRGPTFGTAQALSSRYHAFSAWLWVVALVLAAYVAARLLQTAATGEPRARRLERRVVLAANLAALPLTCLPLAWTNWIGLEEMRAWQSVQRENERCVVEYAGAPDSCLELFYPDPDRLRTQAAFLEQHRLSIFREPAALP